MNFNENKIEALAERILHLCAEEGFTLAELGALPLKLRSAIEHYITRVKECTKVTFSEASETPDIALGTSEQNPDDLHLHSI